MATIANPFPVTRREEHEPPNNIKLYPERYGDVSHLPQENMPPNPRRHEVDEEFNIREAVHVFALASTSMCKAIEAQAQAAPKTNGGSQKWTGWIQTGVICAMLLVSGTNAFKSSEGDLKLQIALQDQQLKQQTESLRGLTDRVLSIEFIWARVRQDIAAYGLQIDAQSGAITQVKKGR